jgi:glyceraldehyde-3-phosphate dehydrogenase/erythrose-4-phosphate dehydrogenase
MATIAINGLGRIGRAAFERSMISTLPAILHIC